MLMLVLILTYSIGISGIAANSLLIYAIRRHTPESLRNYAKIFLTSAICDCFGLFSLLFSATKEVVFRGSCMLEFPGACSKISDEACWITFGVQQHMYCTAVSLLSLSFAYRLDVIGESKWKIQKYLSRLIAIVVVFQSFVVPGFHRSMGNGSRQTAFIAEYREAHPDAENSLGLLFADDLFSFCVTAYTILTAIFSFIIIAQLRNLTIKRISEFEMSMSATTRVQNKMLNDALNFQLACSSFFFIGVMMFNVNLVFEGSSPDLASICVQVANLQNVCSPLTNLYFITSYRKFIIRLLPGNFEKVKTISSNTTNMTSTVHMIASA